MAEKMLKFVEVGPQMPDKRDAGTRRADFGEIYQGFPDDRAAIQAARCSQCGVPGCHSQCPLHNNIPDWLRLTAEGRLEEAYLLAQATNNFPEICGRICPQDRLCEGNCVIERSGHGTVTIGAIEKYLTDTAWEQGWVKPRLPLRERGRSVGVIGAGPAGLAAAEELRARGFGVTVYDRYDRAGGLMVYGIPSFKLDKGVVARRQDLLAQQGVIFEFGFSVGRDASLAELRARHDAVLIATGVYAQRDEAMPGAGLGNIVQALDFLVAANRAGFGADVTGAPNAQGRDVVVIGGGDTAMDCVRTAVRQGARSVKCLYRRDRANMPGSVREVRHAEEEGVEFIWLTAPRAYVGDEVVSGVRAVRMRLGLPDASGRQTPQAIDGSDATIKADLVIKAMGFDPEDLPTLFGAPDLPVTRWGTVLVDAETQMTKLPGVFAAGDIVRGASLVVWAVRDGRVAATGIARYLASIGQEG